MKKIILKSGIGFSLAVLMVGCVLFVPEFAKAETQQSVKKIYSSNNERLACEYLYCAEHSIMEKDKNCLPAKKHKDSFLKSRGVQDWDIDIDAERDYSKQCPHMIRNYPF